MKAVIQRVESAEVRIDGASTGSIGKGILVLLGVERGDEEKDAEYLVDKIVNLRIFEDAGGKMNLSLLDISGELLVVSQFTLLADMRKGRRPSFTDAAEPDMAEDLYEHFVTAAAKQISRVETGRFQALMKISLVNDGPVTMLLDTRILRR